jgi:hypothetical protein
VLHHQKKTHLCSNFYRAILGPLGLRRVGLCAALSCIIATIPLGALPYFDAHNAEPSHRDDARDDDADLDLEIDSITESLYLIARAEDDDLIRVYEIGTLKDPVAGHNIIAYQVKGIPLLPRANVVFPLRFAGMRLRSPRIMTVNISHRGLLYIRHDDTETSDSTNFKGKRPRRIKPPGVFDVLFALGAVIMMVVLLRRRGIAKQRRRKVKIRSDVIVG